MFQHEGLHAYAAYTLFFLLALVTKFYYKSKMGSSLKFTAGAHVLDSMEILHDLFLFIIVSLLLSLGYRRTEL